MLANPAFSVTDEQQCGASTGTDVVRGPTSDPGPELALPAPPSSTSRAQQSPVGGSGVEREYGGKGAPTPSLPDVIVGAYHDLDIPLHFSKKENTTFQIYSLCDLAKLI
jgi:hypothetical protein